jgi:hypothetical protein
MPSGASGTFKFKVHVTDSGNPELTSPDVQLSIAVAAPHIFLREASLLQGVRLKDL